MTVTLFAILAATSILLVIEYFMHQKRLRSIPIRIHVNGTRGKSSVTRLIAGALREHGIRTFAKTTGTLPRMIMEDGSEYPIYRPLGANIIEQLRIISFAAKNQAEALVIECMAVQPQLQSIAELKIVRATHGVITNARPDHLDVMGPSTLDVAKALLGTVPLNGQLFTSEQEFRKYFSKACVDRKCQLNLVGANELSKVSDEDMVGFGYVEHKENVALVLKVCDSLKIPKDVALRGMKNAKQDVGAMSQYKIDFFSRQIFFVNGFAANDPESSEKIWHMALERNAQCQKRIMILNTRADRPDRSLQLGEAIAKWPAADAYILIGSGVHVLFKAAVKAGIDSSKFIYAEGMEEARIFEEVLGLSKKSTLVMGIGNIGGPGLDVVKYFKNRMVLE